MTHTSLLSKNTFPAYHQMQSLATSLESEPQLDYTTNMVFRLLQLRFDLRFWLILISLAYLVAGLAVTISTRPFVSDDVAQQVLLQQWFSGYHSITYIGTDNFIDKFPLYLIMHWLIAKPRLELIVTGYVLNLAGFGFLILALRRLWPANRPTLYLLLPWVFSLSTWLYLYLITPNLRNLEIGLMLYLLSLAKDYTEGKLLIQTSLQRVVTLIGILVIGLLIFSDPIYLFLIILPLLGFLAVQLYFGRWSSLTFKLLLYVISGTAIHFLLLQAAPSFGFITSAQPVSFVTIDQVSTHFQWMITGLLNIIGANFFGQLAASATTIASLMTIVTMLIALIWPFTQLKSAFRTNSPAWQLYFGFIPHWIILIFIFSSVVVDPGAARYLIFIPFFLLINLGLFYYQLPSFKVRFGLILLLSVTILLHTPPFLQERTLWKNNPNADTVATVSQLKQAKVQKIYTDYWSAPITTFFSRQQFNAISVICYSHQLHLYYWMAEDAVLNLPTKTSAILYNPRSDLAQGCSLDDISTQFGPASTVSDVSSGQTLLQYDYDLRSKLN